MANMFKQPAMPKIEPPKTVRMPTATDPEVIAAATRTRSAALQRQGRQSTIMTDMTRTASGSSGQKLGA
jgi:hypothetical protein